MKVILRIVIVVFSLNALVVSAQETIKVMSYNLLNFPLGDMPGRMDTLSVILQHHQPDLFLAQELKAEFALIGIEEILDNSSIDDFIYAPWISQQSNPGGSFLQQGLVYNTRLFGLSSQEVILTDTRDVNYYKLFYNAADLAQGADTTFLHIYITHLKASQGATNEQLRLAAIQDFQPHLNALESDDLVIFAGDLNLYSSSEPAYQALLNPANDPRLFDPIDSPGTWSSSAYPFKNILTQSTRTTQVFGDGASGGLDDRFDFILCSEALLDELSPIHYVNDSYIAFGNSGLCYNEDILDCADSNGLPESVTSALYYLSDHLPVVMELESPLALSSKESPITQNTLFYHQGSRSLLFTNPVSGDITVYDLHGRVVAGENLNQAIHYSLFLPAGTYVAILQNAQGLVRLKFPVIH